MIQAWLSFRYENARETVKKLCSSEISEKIKPVWGFDEEHEFNSVWRDCGVDKMWILFGMVGFPHYPHNPLNFKCLESREYREHICIEIPFKLCSAPNQSHEGRNIQRRKILAVIYERLGLIT